MRPRRVKTGLEVVAVWKAVAEVSTLTMAMVKRLVMEVGPGVQTVPKAVSVKVSDSIPCYWLAVECHCAL